MCASVAKSGLGGLKTPEQAFAMAAQALADDPQGAESPMAFLRALGRAQRDFHIINGRPTMKAETMLARFQAAGGKVVWEEYSDQRCSAQFSHPQGGSIVLDWTMARAKSAGLIKPGPWMTHPRAMLRSRVISEAIRTVYPGILSGSYTPDEIEEIAAPAPPVRVEAQDTAGKDRARALYLKVTTIDGAAAKDLHARSGGNPAEFCALAEQWLADREPVVIPDADAPTESTPATEGAAP